MKEFWRHFLSGDNSVVNTAAVLAVALAAPVIVLASACVIYHVFVMHKGVDAPIANLLLGMLGAATGGIGAMGVSMFSRTTMSQFTSFGMGGMGAGVPPPVPGINRARPAP